MKSLSKICFFWSFLILQIIAFGQDYSPGVFSWNNEDLKVTKFRNGDNIFYAESDEEWEQVNNEGKPAYCFVDGDESKGVLYNWFAVIDPRGLAPEGYRIPNAEDFQKLVHSGIELKSNNGDWVDPNMIGNSVFNAKAKGYRTYDGSSFLSFGYINYYWTTDKGKALHAKRLGVLADQGTVMDQGRREDGCSVRLIRDFSISVMPSEIVASKSTLKPNEKVILRVNDGALGEGAQFYWFKGQCPTISSNSFATGRVVNTTLQESSEIFVAIFKGTKKIGCKSIKITVKDESILPSAINGDDSACEGGYIDLRLNDGELCTTCDWYWYDSQNFSGVAIATGWTISIKSSTSKTYYVRSESKSTGKVTDHISKFISVYQKPPDPSAINFISGNEICYGDLLQCSVKGPELSNSTWIWEYNGKQTEGERLKDYMYKSSSIQVYAKNFCGRSSNPLTGYITVNSKSTSPTSIVNGTDNRKTYLVQKGGSTGTGAQWEWYRLNNRMNEKHVGSGDKIYINPRKSATYIVRAEGGKCESNAELKRYYQRKPKVVGSSSWAPYFSNSSGWLHFGTDLGIGISFLNEKVSSWDSVSYFKKSGYDLFWNLNLHLVSKEFFMLGVNGGIGGGIYSVPVNNYLYLDRDDLYGIDDQEFYTGSLRMGGEMLIGFLRNGKAKFLVNYNQSITLNDLTFTYSNSQKEDFSYYLNQETFGFGVRIGSNGQKNKSKQLDLIFTLNDINNQSIFFRRNYSDLGKRQMGLQCNFWIHSALKVNTGILFNNLAEDISAGNYNALGAYFSIAYSWDRFR